MDGSCAEKNTTGGVDTTNLLETRYGELLANFVFVLIILATVDHTIIKPWVAKRVRKAQDVDTARWFFVHALANALTCATALNSMYHVARDPIHAFDGAAYSDEDTSFFGAISKWPLLTINAVHVYHMVGGFKLTSGDYFHHGLFIPTIALPGSLYRWGPVGNWQAFFMSGFPGGIDCTQAEPLRLPHSRSPAVAQAVCKPHRVPCPHLSAVTTMLVPTGVSSTLAHADLLLGLCKVGMCDHMLEKRVNANLNTWCRAPGVVVAFVICYQGLLLGHSGENLPAGMRPPMWAMLLQLFLPIYNALYFGKQAVANYSVHYMLSLLGQDELIRQHIEQRTSKTTGTEVMSWKDALVVPQRGC